MSRFVAFLATLGGGLGLDLWSKALAFRHVPHERAPEIEVIQNFFYIAHARNSGAMWSLFQDIPAWIWILLRGGVSVLIFWFYLTRPKLALWVHIAFALVLAGALGNLHDNIFCGGTVRDFLRFIFWGWSFPTFNVADSMICVGAGLLFIYFLRVEAEAKVRAAA